MPEPTPTQIPPPLPRLEPRPLWRQSLDAHDDLEEGDQRGHQSIGGWLIVFAIGRVLAPFFLGYALLADLVACTTPRLWSPLPTPGSVSYHPLWSTVILYETVGNGLLLLFSLALVGLFFARWKAFVPLMVAYMVALACFYWGDYLICQQIPALVARSNNNGLATAIQGTLTALIWSPYFLTSVRVKWTFVK